jgi:AI-2 transport protein TqsA
MASPTPAEPPIRTELRIQTICLAVMAVVAAGFALAWLRLIIIPFIMAVFLALSFMPLVDFLELRARLSRTVGACMALLLAVVLIIGLGVLVDVSIKEIFANADQYESRLNALVVWIEELPSVQWLSNKTTAVATANSKPVAPPTTPGEPPSKPPNAFAELVSSYVQSMLLGATGLVGGVAWAIVSQGALVLIFLFFLLMSSVKRDRPIGGAWGEMEDRIRAYLITMTAVSAVTGVLVGAVLAIFAVPAAVLFGLLTFLLNFIPSVGSFIAILLPVPIVFLSPNFTTAQAIAAVGIPTLIQFIIGNFIQPKLMGEHMRLHPVVILLALIFWGTLWGVVGAFLAVPLTSIIRIACDRHPFTKPIAGLMAGHLDSLRNEPPPPAEVLAEPS